jgi:hypothetical protein
MKKLTSLIIDKILYVIAVLIISALGFVWNMSNRLNAVETSSTINTLEHKIVIERLDKLEQQNKKILCFVGDKISCQM